jgi:TP901 family phage tail tape measure protein
MNVRELVTRFLFQADTGKVEAFAAAVEQAKVVATKAGTAVASMAEAVKPATEVMARGAQAVGQAGQQAGKAMQGAATAVEGAAAAMVHATEGIAEAVTVAAERVKPATTAMAEGVHSIATAAEETARRTAVATQAMGAEFEAARIKADELAGAVQPRGPRRGADGRFLPSDGAGSGGSGGSPNEEEEHRGRRGGRGAGAGILGALGGLGHHIGRLVAGYVGFQAAEASFEHFAEFQQNIQKAGAAMMGTPEQIETMRKRALDVSGDTGYNPRQVSEGMIEIAGKGFHAHDVNQMIPTAMKLARAGMVDPKTATELLTATTEGFYGRDKGAEKHVEIGDMLAVTHDTGGIPMHALLETMKYMAPAAGALKQNMGDMMTMTALLGRFGLQGSMAGNGLKSMMIKLAAPTSMNSKKLADAGFGEDVSGEKGKHHKKVGMSMVHALGLTVSDPKTGDMLPMVQIMQQIVAKTAKMGTTRKTAIFKDLFGLEDIPQGMAIARTMAEDGGKAFNEVSARINNSTGALARMNEIMQQGLTPAWQRMFAKLEIVAALLLERLSPGLVGLMDGFGAMADRLKDFIQNMDVLTDHGKNLHGVLVALKVAAAGLLLFLTGDALLGFVAGVGEAAVALAELGDVFAFLEVVSAIAAASMAAFVPLLIGALVVGIPLALQDLATYFDGGDSVTGRMIDAFNRAAQIILARFPAVGEFIVNAFNSAREVMGPFFDGMLANLLFLWNFLSTIWNDPKNAWTAFVAYAVQTFTSLKDILLTAIDAIITAFAGAFGITLPGFLTNIPALFDDTFGKVYNFIASWVDKGIAKLDDLAKKIPGAGLFGTGGDTTGSPDKPATTGEKAMPNAGGWLSPTLTMLGGPMAVPTAPTIPTLATPNAASATPATAPNHFYATLNVHAETAEGGKAAGEALIPILDSWFDQKHRESHADSARSLPTRKN